MNLIQPDTIKASEDFPLITHCPFCGNQLKGGKSFTVRLDARIYFCESCKRPDTVIEKGSKKIHKKHQQGINILLYSDGSFSPTKKEMETFPIIEKHRKIKPLGSKRRKRK